MKRLIVQLLAILALCGTTSLSQETVLQLAGGLELDGRFKEAAGKLTSALQNPALTAADRAKLQFELDRLERIKIDYPFTKDALFGELKKSIKNLTSAEFEEWISENRFDSRDIDGERCFMGFSVGNLFWRYPELSGRRIAARDTRAVDKRHWQSCVAIKKAALAGHRPYVLPKRFHVGMTVTAEPNAAPEGETIRAWLPIPRDYPWQSDFSFASVSAALKHIESKDSPIRCAYLEKAAVKDRPTVFRIEYDYTTQGVWFEVNPEQVRAIDPNNPSLQEFTREGPHIVFSPEMRALSERIGGKEQNPYLKAKKFHDWIAENIKYSFAIEYSTIRNISEYCRSRGYGDCGQEALLFMTLCRLNGIPARWQSGWNTFPGAKSNHE
jgi:transglutaminase superfamily protein